MWRLPVHFQTYKVPPIHVIAWRHKISDIYLADMFFSSSVSSPIYTDERKTLWIGDRVLRHITHTGNTFRIDDAAANCWCRIYASVSWVSTGSGNGLSPVRRQAQCWIIVNWTPGIGILSFLFNKMHLKVLSAKMVAILSRGRWVKMTAALSLWQNEELQQTDKIQYYSCEPSESCCVIIRLMLV